MRSRLAVGLVAVCSLLAPAGPAYADHGGGYQGRDDCRDGGGCNNERHENYDGAGCKYVCPTFDKSPVQDSFNPTICVMPGSCANNDKKPSEKQQPASMITDPKKLVTFPLTVAEMCFTFAESILKLVV